MRAIGSQQQVAGFYDQEWSRALPSANYDAGAEVFQQTGVPAEALRNKKVLDAGCGLGVYSITMARDFGAEVTAVDIEQRCVDIARQAATERGLPISTQVDDLKNLSLPDNAFDTIVSIGVVHHTGDADSCLRSFLRVLKPGGDLYVSVIRLSPLVRVQHILYRVFHALPKFAQAILFEVILVVAWVATRFSAHGRVRFTGLRIGVRDAVYCPYHQIEDDAGWLEHLRRAGYVDVRKVRSWNVWGHQGLYAARKP